MLDPLRSLAQLVRTLTRPRGEHGATPETRPQGNTSERASSAEPNTAVNANEALRARLRQRLRAVGTLDKRRAREVFVETVLASELGDAVTLDPAMGEIIARVAEQLSADAATERDLGLLFDDLARDSG